MNHGPEQEGSRPHGVERKGGRAGVTIRPNGGQTAGIPSAALRQIPLGVRKCQPMRKASGHCGVTLLATRTINLRTHEEGQTHGIAGSQEQSSHCEAERPSGPGSLHAACGEAPSPEGTHSGAKGRG